MSEAGFFVPEERIMQWVIDSRLEPAKKGKNPCNPGCPGRSSTCHAECEAYLSFHAHNRQENKKQLMQSYINDYINKEVTKSKRGW